MSTSKHSSSMRLFTAIPMPKPIADKLESWTNEYKPKLTFRKWTDPRDYHITLQFLGDVPAQKVDALAAGLHTVQSKPLALMLNGIGTFGPPKTPRVLWAAVSGELAQLNALQSAVTGATSLLGFEKEDRPYAPHITLARGYAGGSDDSMRSRVDKSDCDGDLLSSIHTDVLSGMQWEVDSFVLMRTHMHASPMYETIGKFLLG
ncbi:2'-5' RNA ligase [Paenibacillus castaneae]|uniref:RNA 2',3'-cyclic phosphodiesterase n=1 Tax=Paenibacillus castaneae TaxID=474957 RepID=UPI000C9B3751|nr:RNA 2',3'-cyclic phosphodiesterase [Paenibacillus castaneae]NIK80086.1 2'-5' RNA ligase [Paenibacillus castaneae]